MTVIAHTLLEAIVKGLLEAPLEQMRPSELVEENVKLYLADRFQVAMWKSDEATELVLKNLYFQITNEHSYIQHMKDPRV